MSSLIGSAHTKNDPCNPEHTNNYLEHTYICMNQMIWDYVFKYHDALEHFATLIIKNVHMQIYNLKECCK